MKAKKAQKLAEELERTTWDNDGWETELNDLEEKPLLDKDGDKPFRSATPELDSRIRNSKLTFT